MDANWQKTIQSSLQNRLVEFLTISIGKLHPIINKSSYRFLLVKNARKRSKIYQIFNETAKKMGFGKGLEEHGKKDVVFLSIWKDLEVIY